jgi:hypothetical protein
VKKDGFNLKTLFWLMCAGGLFIGCGFAGCAYGFSRLLFLLEGPLFYLDRIFSTCVFVGGLLTILTGVASIFVAFILVHTKFGGFRRIEQALHYYEENLPGS